MSVHIGPHDDLRLPEVRVPQSIICTGQMPGHMQFAMDNSFCDPLSLREAVSIQNQLQSPVPVLSFRIPSHTSAEEVVRGMEEQNINDVIPPEFPDAVPELPNDHPHR